MNEAIWDAPADTGSDEGGEAEAGEAVEAAPVTGKLAAAYKARATLVTEGEGDGTTVAGSDDDGADLANEGDDAQEDDDNAPEYHEVKVDGEVLELTLDELKAGYSRMGAATKRFQEAAQLKGEVQDFVGKLRAGDPQMIASLFGKLGVDFTKVAEEHLSQYLDDMQRPEHERGMRQLEREREEWRREQEMHQQTQQEAQIEQASKREQHRMRTEMTQAFTANGIPDSPPMVARVAQQLEMALTHGYPMTVAEAVQVVAEEARAMLRKLPPEAANRLLGGAAAADSLRRSEAQRVDSKQKQRAASVAKGASAPRRSAPLAKAVNPERGDDLKAFFDS